MEPIARTEYEFTLARAQRVTREWAYPEQRRNVIVGLGSHVDGSPRQTGFDITGAVLSVLVPRQATFARLTRSRSARSCALRLRQMM